MSFPRYPRYKDSGVDWLGELPDHWALKPLWTFFRRVKRTGHPDEQLLSVYRDFGVVPKASRDDNHNKPSDDLALYQLVLPGELAINKMKAWQGSVAISSHRGILSPAYFVYSASHHESDRYLHYLMRSVRYICGYLAASKGIRISQWDLEPQSHSRMPVLVPPFEEQTAIAAFLDRETAKIDELVAEQRRLMELLKEKRQAVISHAVTKGLNPHVPMKPSGIEWLGDVPAHWEVKRLRHIAERLQGRLIVQPHLYFADEGVPIVFGYNIKDGCIDEAGLSRIDYETDRKHSHAKARAGDLFTVRLGDPGKTAVVPKSLDGCHFASIMWIQRNPHFHSEWLCHSMNSAVVQRQIEAVNYGAAQTQFNIRDAVDFRLPVPPLDEQREIAAFLERQLTALEALGMQACRAIDLLQERRTALISAAVTGQIDVRNLAKGEAA